MKKIILATFLLVGSLAFAQSPEKMSYQAVVRNTTNNLVTNQAVGMQISILQGSATGTAVYVETQNPTSNANGLVSLEIGSGSVVSGSMASINWANGPYFIKTETDPTGGTSYTITGTSQLLSTPYALYAKTSGGNWKLTGNTGTSASTNFIGNYDDVNLVFKVNNVTSGFISANNTNYNTSFGYNAGNNSANVANAAFGYKALSVGNGADNTAIGTGAFELGTSFVRSVALGHRAGQNANGSQNVIIGKDAMQSGATIASNTGSSNVVIGHSALKNNTSGSNNIAIGEQTLINGATHNQVTAIGGNINVATPRTNITAIGYGIVDATITQDNMTRIGNDFVTKTDIAGQLKVNSQSTTNDFTLPATRGTANQVLSTDGAGATQWVTPSVGGSTYPNIELDVRNNVTQSITSLGNGTSSNLITFSGGNSASASLTGGNTWNGTTLTVGSTGAGWYQINAQIVGVQTDGVTSSNIGIPFYMDLNNTVGSTMSSAILYRSNYSLNTNATHLKNNNTISSILYLSAGNTLNFYGFSASNTVTGNTSNNGSTYLNIVRIK